MAHIFLRDRIFVENLSDRRSRCNYQLKNDINPADAIIEGSPYNYLSCLAHLHVLDGYILHAALPIPNLLSLNINDHPDHYRSASLKRMKMTNTHLSLHPGDDEDNGVIFCYVIMKPECRGQINA